MPFLKGHCSYTKIKYQKILFVCSICKKEFLIRENSDRKYCSTKCYGDSKKGHISVIKKQRENRTCLVCKREFLTRKDSTRKYCSFFCYRSRIKNKIQKYCLNCGELLIGRSKIKFCSRNCSFKFHVGKNSSQSGKERSLNTKRILKEKFKIITTARWQDIEFALKVSKSWKNKPNKKEILLDTFLQKEDPNEWKYVGDGYTWIAGKNPDYLNINGRKAVIELLGCYWHNCPICYPGKGETDAQERIEHYKKSGFDCLTIWEHELNDLDMIKSKMDNFYAGGIRC